MSITLPEKPAWRNPKDQSYDLLEPTQEQKLFFDECKLKGKLSRLGLKQDCYDNPIHGYYLLKCNLGDYFLKVVSQEKAKQLIDAERIVQYLHSTNCSVSIINKGYPVIHSNDNILFSADYIDSRLAACNSSDLTKIGKGIGEIHASLNLFQDSNEICNKTLIRDGFLKDNIKEFENMKDHVLDGHKISRLLLDYKYYFEFDFGERQIIHGDLNYHNICFNKKNNRAIFLDFEDSLYSFYNPIIDLAFILERFVLNENLNFKEKLKIVKAFWNSYRDSTSKIELKDNTLFHALRFIQIRSLAILTSVYVSGCEIPTSEWQKFVYYFGLTFKNKSFIRKVEKVFAEK